MCFISGFVQCHIYESKATQIYRLLEKRCNLHEFHILYLKTKNSNLYWCDLCLTWIKGNELLIAFLSGAQNSLDKSKKASQHDCIGSHPHLGWGVSWDLGLPPPWEVCYSLDQDYSFSMDESWSGEQGLLENMVPSVGSSAWQQWAVWHTKQFTLPQGLHFSSFLRAWCEVWGFPIDVGCDSAWTWGMRAIRIWHRANFISGLVLDQMCLNNPTEHCSIVVCAGHLILCAVRKQLSNAWVQLLSQEAL